MIGSRRGQFLRIDRRKARDLWNAGNPFVICINDDYPVIGKNAGWANAGAVWREENNISGFDDLIKYYDCKNLRFYIALL